MKLFQTCRKSARVAAAVGVMMALVLLPGCKKKAPMAPTAAKPAVTAAASQTNGQAMSATNLTSEFVSVFDDKLPPDKGRDPFYPDSRRREPAAAPGIAGQIHVDPVLKLHGVVGSPGRWLAAVNNQILAQGEDSPVRLPDGSRVNVHVVEIGPDYAIVTVEGQTGQKRLTMDQKNQ
jgi:hypothetical protein